MNTLQDRLEEGAECLLSILGSRESIAFYFGYFPAWRAWELKDTYGLPLIHCAMRCKEHGLSMDWMGIRYEAAKRGADVDGEVAEAQREMQLAISE